MSRPQSTWWIDLALIALVVTLLPGIGLRFAPGPLPLSYANANTAAATQVMALCGLALLGGHRDRWGRSPIALCAATAAFAVVHHGSQAGMATAIPVALALLLLLVRPARRAGWAVALGLTSLAAAGAALLRIAALDTWPVALDRALDPMRHRLWDTALALWTSDPIAGAGPGSYVEVNPFASDPDTAAAHSSVLQVGAELGAVGVVLLSLLVLTGYIVATRGRPSLAVLATAAWTALWVHSLIDHLFDYPALPLLAGIVLGWAGSPRPVEPSEELDVAQSEGPVAR